MANSRATPSFSRAESCGDPGVRPFGCASVLSADGGYACAERIIPAATVSFVDSSIRMNAPVERFSA
jgi:hypothetical protein